MSLIRCCECKKDVSEYADKCPNCGCPMEIIKKNSNLNRKTIFFESSQEELDLSFLEQELKEEELRDSDKLFQVLENHGLKFPDRGIIQFLIEFNNYKFPKDYQTCYEMMLERNQASHIKCPTCGSKNVTKVKKPLVGVSMLGGMGILNENALKTFECRNCGYKW